MGRTLEQQNAAEEMVVRRALDSTWNAYGGDTIEGNICAVAACGLDQGVIQTVASWDSDGVFRNRASVDSEVDRICAIIGAIRRLVDKEVREGGALQELPSADATVRYSLGATFRSGRSLAED